MALCHKQSHFGRSWCFKESYCFAFSSILGCRVSCHLSSALPLVSPYSKFDSGISPPDIVLCIVGLWFPRVSTTRWFTMRSEFCSGNSGRGWERKTGLHFSWATVGLTLHNEHFIPENSGSAWMESLHLCPYYFTVEPNLHIIVLWKMILKKNPKRWIFSCVFSSDINFLETKTTVSHICMKDIEKLKLF